MIPTKVLIVDDSVVIRRCVRTLFETDSTFEVCGIAGDGQQAIEQAERLRPDLVIMDLSMPVLNGLDATRGIKRIKPEAQIILFSRYTDAFQPDEARGSGISAFVSKNEPHLLLKIARIVAQAGQAA